MPKETVESWKNLWFHTGDMRFGWTKKDIFIFLIERKKMYSRRGENISSYEIERVINDHPKVFESAIVGVPSELSEEEVLAVVILKDRERLNPEDFPFTGFLPGSYGSFCGTPLYSIRKRITKNSITKSREI